MAVVSQVSANGAISVVRWDARLRPVLPPLRLSDTADRERGAMTPQLVLSLFPGIGLLDSAFEEEGFIVVRGPDLIWGGECGGERRARHHRTRAGSIS